MSFVGRSLWLHRWNESIDHLGSSRNVPTDLRSAEDGVKLIGEEIEAGLIAAHTVPAIEEGQVNTELVEAGRYENDLRGVELANTAK
jgi:hypothetical protein